MVLFWSCSHVIVGQIGTHGATKWMKVRYRWRIGTSRRRLIRCTSNLTIQSPRGSISNPGFRGRSHALRDPPSCRVRHVFRLALDLHYAARERKAVAAKGETHIRGRDLSRHRQLEALAGTVPPRVARG